MADLEDIVAQSAQELQEDTVNNVEEVTEDPQSDADSAEASPLASTSDATEGSLEAGEGERGPDGKFLPKKPATQEVVDEFAKKIGLPAESAPGRENRIPYSRVKKIVEKAEKDAIDRVTKELEGKATPRIAEFETKIKDYETRLEKVGQFEQIMFNDAKTFLPMLEQIPAYKEFFTFVRNAMASQYGMDINKGLPTSQEDPDAMPQPDANGGYSMPQLQKLMDWQARQTEKRIAAKYAPMEQQWQAQQKIQQAMPAVQRQIDEARTWPLFKENEAEITAAFRADETLSLEGAYRKVVFPKLQSDRAKIEEEARKAALEDMKRASQSTSVTTRQTRPVSKSGEAPKDLEDVIWDSIRHLK